MNFLQPIWLYAIAGIIVPIAIHFWNIKEGKAYAVGSIALLERSSKKYTRTLRINEWLLLILRCLLIIALAMLLAKPARLQKFTAQKGWVLLDTYNTGAIYNHFKNVIDSLLAAGFVLHNFDEQLKETSLKQVLAASDTTQQQTSYWSIIKKADNRLPAAFPLYVFTNNLLKNFMGERPQVNSSIKWFAYSKDTVVKQIAKAWLTNENNIRVMLVNSTPAGNIFSYAALPLDDGQNNNYKIALNSKQTTVAYNNQAPVIVDSTTMHINIYAGKNKQDAGYIKASLDAIRRFTKRRMQVNVVSNAATVSPENDWLFWLGGNELPSNIKAKNILKYESGKDIMETSTIEISNLSQPVSIYKRIIADSLSATSPGAIWKDGFGNPLLIKEQKSNNNIYHFYSRFNPSWNDLVWSDVFPTLLLHLIFEDESKIINTIYDDMRIIDERQIQPTFVNNPRKSTPSPTEDLSTAFRIIIFLLFSAERIASFKNKTNIVA